MKKGRKALKIYLGVHLSLVISRPDIQGGAYRGYIGAWCAARLRDVQPAVSPNSCQKAGTTSLRLCQPFVQYQIDTNRHKHETERALGGDTKLRSTKEPKMINDSHGDQLP